VVDVELSLQAPARLKQPIRPPVRDRARPPFALGVQRAAALAQPRAATPRARHEPLRIKLDRDPLVTVTVTVGPLGRLAALAVEAFPGLAQRLAPPLACAQVLGQLVAALRAVQLALAPIDLRGLFKDLAGDLAEVAIGVDRRSRDCLEGAAR
jgi:hypothetical protein